VIGNFKPDLFGRWLSPLDHRIEITAIYVLGHGKTDLGASSLLMEQEIQGGPELLSDWVIHVENDRAFAQEIKAENASGSRM
jgi:hypothetical protein